MSGSKGTAQRFADGAVAILDSMPAGFFSVDQDWNLTYVNRHAAHLLGIERSAAIGKSIWDTLPGFGRTAFAQTYRHGSGAHRAAGITFYYPERDRWYESQVAASATGLSFHVRDISAQNATEQALRRSEHDFRLMADSVPQIIWIVMASGEAVYFNRQWDDYTGVPIASSTPAAVGNQFVHPDDLAVTMSAWAHAYEQHRPFHVEHRIRSRTGEYRWFLVRAEPFLNPAGEIERWFGTSTDIHEEKMIKVALQVEQRRRSFQLTLADRIRPLLNPADVSAAACLLLGKRLGGKRVVYGEADDSGMSLVLQRDWTDGELASMGGMRLRLADFGAAVSDQLRAGRNLVIDDVMRVDAALPHMSSYTAAGIRAVLAIPLIKEGRLRAVLSVHDNEIHAWTPEQIAMAEDVVDRTWFAVESARAQNQLRDADRRKDEFLAMLAHELRNPLAPIGAAAHLLRLGRLDQERVRHTSEIIDRQVQHMTHLVDDLLDVSRVTRGLVELENAPLDLRQVLDEAVEQVTPLIQARHHRLHAQLSPGTMTVSGDRKRLVQVLANLLNNAAKYTPEGGTITLGMALRGDSVAVEVADNGIGMTPDLAAHAFELFAQAERTPDRSAGGLGLGLALVRSLVELHGGSVTCDSAGLGRGSSFTVCLPRFHGDAATLASGAALHAGAQAGTQDVDALRILVVDDNADAAAMLGMLLESQGHRVAVEYGSRSALARARLERPQVCLLDIGLPDIDGNELAVRLRAMPEAAGAVLIAVSGYGQDSDRRQSLAAGFAHHLVKPVDAEQLIGLLAEIVASARHTAG